MRTNRTIHGDCLEVMPLLPTKSVDMVITSPPYDNLRTYNGYSFDFENTALELYCVVKLGGVVIWIVADATVKGSETCTSFRQAIFFKECGFNLHDTMIYAKNSYMPLTHSRYEQAWEYMFCFSKGKPSCFNPIMIPCLTAGTRRNRGGSKANGDLAYSERKRDEKTTVNTKKQHPNIFYYDVGKNEKTTHPAPYPLNLVMDQVISWSNLGDTILDPFAGSGTTGVACINTDRRYIQIEQDPKYVKIARTRCGEK